MNHYYVVSVKLLLWASLNGRRFPQRGASYPVAGGCSVLSPARDDITSNFQPQPQPHAPAKFSQNVSAHTSGWSTHSASSKQSCRPSIYFGAALIRSIPRPPTTLKAAPCTYPCRSSNCVAACANYHADTTIDSSRGLIESCARFSFALSPVVPTTFRCSSPMARRPRRKRRGA